MKLALLLGAVLLQEESVESGVAPCRPLRPSRDAALRPLLEPFESADKEFRWELRESSRSEKLVTSWLRFPSAVQGPIEENNTVWARYWEPRDDRRDRPS
jgi:hypothetical protein